MILKTRGDLDIALGSMAHQELSDLCRRANDEAAKLIKVEAPNRYGLLPFVEEGDTFRFNPNRLLRRFRHLIGDTPLKTAFDMPCGLGRDSFYLLSKGFDVTSVDVDQGVLDFIDRWAGVERLKLGGHVETVKAGFGTFNFRKTYGLALSMNGLHFARTREMGQQFIRKMQEHTVVGGLHLLQAMNIHDPTPGRSKREARGIKDYLVEPEELRGLYDSPSAGQWGILDYCGDEVHESKIERSLFRHQSTIIARRVA